MTALKLACVASCELAPWCWNPSSSRVPRVLTDFPRCRSAVDMGLPFPLERWWLSTVHIAHADLLCKYRRRRVGAEWELERESRV